MEHQGTVVEVLPDVAGLDRTFHYLVPPSLGEVQVGTVVRVALHGRRTRGWVVAAGTDLPEGINLKAIREIVSLGPPPRLVSLCRWASWRYAGRLRPLLLAASPQRIVRPFPTPPASPLLEARRDTVAEGGGGPPAADVGLRVVLEQVVSKQDAVLRLPPRMPRLDAVLGLLELCRATGAAGDPLVLVESRADAVVLAARLRAAGWPVSRYPEDWADAAGGGRVVVGTRNAVLAPVSPSMVIVLDAHSESYRAERAPNFDARVIAAERARRGGIPVCFVTPCPSLELLAGRQLVTLERSRERGGWGTIAVLDAREEDPRERGYPGRLVSMVRSALDDRPGEQVVLVLNRRGRARLLACGLCRTLARCPGCGAALVQPARPPKGDVGELACPRCELLIPAICQACGSGRLRILRSGVTRAREELSALLGLEEGEVGVVTGAPATLPDCPVLVGTESVLHRVAGASMVGFLDFDHELLAPRFRAGEQALVLLARAVRVASRRSTASRSRAAGAGPGGGAPIAGRDAGGGPAGGAFPGRVVIRTSMPGHEVVRAAQHGDPSILAEADWPVRESLRLPPASALAVVSGTGAPGVAERLRKTGADLEVAPLGGGRFLLRAPTADALAEACGAAVAGEAAGWAALDARIEVDPPDL